MFHVEQNSELVRYLTQGCSSLGVTLSELQTSQFACYHRELIRWNEKINLTAITDIQGIAIKHFVDSLACCKALTKPLSEASLLDIGSGGGVPGLPLKILYPDLHLTLLEPNHKKSAFLRHVIGTLELNHAQVFSQTIQQYSASPEHHGRFSYVTTRALSVQPIVHYVEPLLRDTGKFILCRSRATTNRGMGLKLAQEISYDLPYGAGERVLVVLQKKYVPRGTQ